MIEQAARVIQVDGDSVLVATERQSGCQSCDVKGGCGTSLIGQLFPDRPQQHLRLPLGDLKPPPKAGERVIIGIDESYLQISTLLLYAVPLLGLLAGALLGAHLGKQPGSPLGAEPMSILLCLLGLSLGLMITRRTAGNRSGRMARAVKILRVEPSGIVVGIPGAMDNHATPGSRN
jgi:sigma-E factor negative regulatory protein RseC